MKKIISLTLSIFVLTLCIFQSFLCSFFPVSAESEAKITLSVSSSEVTPGTEVTVTLKYTCPVNTAYLYFNVYYDVEKLSFVPAGSQTEASGIINEMISPEHNEDSTSMTFFYKFKAKKVGSADIYVSDVENYRLDPVPGKDDNIETDTSSSVRLSIIEKKLSSNANLKAITPSEGTLTPAFSKDVLSYTVNVSNDKKVCYMDFSLEDREAKASLSGDEFLEVGDNVRTITVTAPDGTVKKYTVNVIRAAAATAPPTEKPTATSSQTSTPSNKTQSPSETPEGTPSVSPSESETPDSSERPTETATDDHSPQGSTDEPFSSEAPTGEPVNGASYIGNYEVFGEDIVLYNASDYLKAAYPGREVIDASNFICSGTILKGLRAYENKNTQYLIYASKNGGDPGIFIVDLTDNTIQRYIGGEKVFDAYDIIQKNGPDETPSPTGNNDSDGNYKYAVSELLDRTIDFGAGHKLFLVAAAILLIVIPLMISGLFIVKSKF